MHSNQIMYLLCRSNSYKMQDAGLYYASLPSARPPALPYRNLQGIDVVFSLIIRVVRAHAVLIESHRGPSAPDRAFNLLCLLRSHRLDIEHGTQQILDHLVLVLFARFLDLLDLGISLLVCVLLGFLVSLRMLL